MKAATILLLNFLLITFLSFSQDFVMLDKYVSPISNSTYNIGDTITIGKATYTKPDIRYSQVLLLTSNSFSPYSKVVFDLSNRKGTIQKIYSNKKNMVSEFTNSVVLELKLSSDTTVFIPIDKALKAREVVVYPWTFDPSSYKPYNGQTSTLINIINQKIGKEDAMLMYMKRHETDKYNEIMSNEFSYEKNKASYINYVDSLVQRTNVNDTFLLILPVQLGKYNFDQKSFPIIPGPLNYGRVLNDVISDQNLYFDNFDQFSSINASAENAEFFVNTGKLEYGDIRQAYAIALIQFQNITFAERSGMNLDGPSKSKETNLHFKVRKLYCVDNSAFYYNFIGSKL